MSGRTAIVTGGASGIGFAIAKRFAVDGNLVAIFDINGKLVLAFPSSAARFELKPGYLDGLPAKLYRTYSATTFGASGEAGHQRRASGALPHVAQRPSDFRVQPREGHDQRLARPKWWRCRDLNPGLRGYEPRALTN